jgi:hypothetical protein
MVVRTQGNGREVTGLHVGTTNARRYFSKGSGAVELRLGDLQIQCRLPASFWDGQPEIHDPRLCEWLNHKVFQQSNRNPMLMAMVQSGDNTFTLQPISFANRRGRVA